MGPAFVPCSDPHFTLGGQIDIGQAEITPVPIAKKALALPWNHRDGRTRYILKARMKRLGRHVGRNTAGQQREEKRRLKHRPALRAYGPRFETGSPFSSRFQSQRNVLCPSHVSPATPSNDVVQKGDKCEMRQSKVDAQFPSPPFPRNKRCPSAGGRNAKEIMIPRTSMAP
jgi:hypothetical protein